jgi:hypothetical protein
VELSRSVRGRSQAADTATGATMATNALQTTIRGGSVTVASTLAVAWSTFCDDYFRVADPESSALEQS